MTRAAMLVLACAALMFAAPASAETLRIHVDLHWEHLPRGAEQTKQGAKLPLGTLIYQRWSDGTRALTVNLDGGLRCSSMVGKGELIYLICGTTAGNYTVSQIDGKQTEVDWSYEAPTGAGEKS